MAKSIFDPHHDGPALSGLDTFTGQPGQSFSNMPDELVDGKVEEDVEETAVEQSADAADAVDAPLEATAQPGDEAVEQIAEALDESRHAEPAKPPLPLPGDAT